MSPARRLRRSASTASVVIAATLVLGVSGCSVAPTPFSASEHIARAQADRQEIDANYTAFDGRLSLAEALARGIKYNYDAQLAKLETTLQERQLDLALAQMLPRVAADAGYSERSNYNAAESVALRTGRRSLEPSYSEERQHGNADVVFSWNLLDVGVSYYQARQQSDRALIAVERRRKVLDGIVKGVTETYWRAATAATLLPQLDPVLDRATKMLESSRAASERHLQAPLQLLDYQQAMITVVGELRRMRNELLSARIQLSSLINVPLDSKLILTTVPNVPSQATADTRVLESIALTMRPELRIEAYQERIDRQDVYKEMLRMMPGVGILAQANYDSNKYLVNNAWGELGVRATFNLVNLINGPKAIAAARTGVEVDHLRRLALSVALLTQVNLNYQQYINSLDELKTAVQIDAVGQQMGQATRNASEAGAQSESDAVRHQLTAMVVRLERDRALARAHTALAGIYSAVGVDLVSPAADLNDLATLTAQIEQSISAWSAGRMPQPDTLADASTPAVVR
jgi:outer membrane protein TolC